MPSELCVSVRGVQCAPPLVVFHTPPPADAMYIVFGFVGSAARPVMRPDVVCPCWSLAMPRGPSSLQLPAKVGAFDGGSERLASCETPFGRCWMSPGLRDCARVSGGVDGNSDGGEAAPARPDVAAATGPTVCAPPATSAV